MFQNGAAQRDRPAMCEHIDRVRMRYQPPEFRAHAGNQLILFHRLVLQSGLSLCEQTMRAVRQVGLSLLHRRPDLTIGAVSLVL